MMLVLTRKESQRINIGNGIVVIVNKIKGNSVRIGIEAPDDVPIRRGELDLPFEHPFPNSQAVLPELVLNLPR